MFKFLKIDEKKKENIIQAVSALILAAITAGFIAIAANGVFFGDDIDAAYDTVYGYESSDAEDSSAAIKISEEIDG